MEMHDREDRLSVATDGGFADAVVPQALVEVLGVTVCVDLPLNDTADCGGAAAGRDNAFGSASPATALAATEWSVGALKAAIAAATGLPEHVQLLRVNQKPLLNDAATALRASDLWSSSSMAAPVFRVTLRGGLLGGKGGFGSLLRAASSKVGQKKTANFGACRDLSGRRLRHTEMETKIAEWQKEQRATAAAAGKSADTASGSGMEKKDIHKEFRKINTGQTRERKPCKWGDACKYQWKCRDTHPNQAVREDRREALKNLGRKFPTAPEPTATREEIVSAVEQGLKARAAAASAGKSIATNGAAGAAGADSDDEAIGNADANGSAAAAASSSANGNGSAGPVVAAAAVGAKRKRNGAATTAAALLLPGDAALLGVDLNGDEDSSESDAAKPAAADAPAAASSSSSASPSASSSSSSSSDAASEAAAPATKKQKVDVAAAPVATATAAPEPAAPAPAAASSATADTAASSSATASSSSASASAAAAATPAAPVALVDVASYADAKALEALGLDALKAQLTARGMKCGGTLKDRAERLFLLKSTPLERLPKKHLAAAPAH